MMKTGMSRPLDPLGRVVIPKEIRDSLNLTEGVRLDIGVANDCVILRRNDAFCACCGNTSPPHALPRGRGDLPEVHRQVQGGGRQ